jgi:hypothetical protein
MSGTVLGAAAAILVSVPVAAWWKIGNVSPHLPNQPTLSYDFGPYDVDPSLERAMGLVASVLLVVGAAVLILATVRHRMNARWWLPLGLASLAGVAAAWAWRAANAGYVGADIGGGPIALIVGGCVTSALLVAAAFVGRSLWTDHTAERHQDPGATETSRETTALILLTAGSLLPVIGWAAGVVVLWSSRLFVTGEKIVATLVLPGGLFAGWVIAGSITGVPVTACAASLPSGCPDTTRISGLTGLMVTLGVWVLSVSGPVWAWWRMRRRATRRAPR